MNNEYLKITRIFFVFSILLITITSCDFVKNNNRSNESLNIIPFSNDNIRFGLIDLQGNIIVENEWENSSTIAMDGIVSVKNKKGNYEFYTATSNPIRIGGEYKQVSLFSEGLAAVVNEQGFIHYIDKQGNIKFELPNDGRGSIIKKVGVFSEGLARFQNSENLWGFINTKGEVIIMPRYDYVRSFKEGLAYVERYNNTTNEKSIGFIDKNDMEIIALSEKYTYFSDFSDGLAACSDKEMKNQWGFVNIQGNRSIKITNILHQVMEFQEGYAAFFDGAYWGLIDKTGKIVVNPKYDKLLAYYHNGLGPFSNSSNLIGFIDANREEVINCQYEEVLPFYSETTIVKDRYYTFIDKKGNPVSDTYIKYVPINKIISEYGDISNALVKNLYVNTSDIAYSVLNSISNLTVNGLSFNSSVRDVMSKYKIPRQKLPQNTYSKTIQYEIDLSGNVEPYWIKFSFDETVQTESDHTNEFAINRRTKLKKMKYVINTKGLSNEQQKQIGEEIYNILEDGNYKLDLKESQESWKANTNIYKLDRIKIVVRLDSSNILISVDFSAFF